MEHITRTERKKEKLKTKSDTKNNLEIVYMKICFHLAQTLENINY